ncbi:ABC transporter permease [Reichenbachiella ulvae]|uniref:ABC transporter permease n=1 Tax=Reichenbachiella ulvae TaxID=2980104 RepID=A0ABT3CY42_9BACT|nr:FtsX-like permease family protein [Reichenbachiella ulvae]MCV9388514.1 ABC transporter permease [Reichenbachiella ulvae]
MLKNFFLVTFRSLLKNKLYSFINISGLAVGLVCSVLILLWVRDELNYDRFIPKADRLHQVWVNAEFDGKINSWNSVPLPTYEAMKTADSHIKNSTVLDWGSDHLLTFGEKRLIKEGYFCGEEFLEMFEFPLIKGDPETVLDDMHSIVITESLAKAMFGEEDPINKVIRVDDEGNLKVTGILKDIPSNSTLEFDYLIPWKYRESVNDWVVRNKTNWGNYSFQVFIELYEADSHLETQAGIENMLMENGEEDMPRKFFLHPMPRWRLYSNFENGEAVGGMSDYVQLFTIIAIFILVMACINFMNLATARSEKRAREVGIRKSLGSTKRGLIMQFIGESLFIALLSFLIAIVLAQLALPFYNELVDKKLFIDYQSPEFWMYGVAIILITGVIAGSYPAFYLSSFKPVNTLKGTVSVGKGVSTPRKILVVLQFGFAIFLMIGTAVIYQQIQMVKSRELGYEKKNLITVYNTDDIADNYELIKQELLRSGAVASVTRSNSPITSIWSNNFLGWPGKPDELKVLFATIATEYDFTQTMGIKMLMGRDFSKEYATDTGAIVINKAALDLMNLEEPIGTNLDLWGGKKKLIGVMDNVLMGSPYEEMRPTFMIIDPEWVSAISVRINDNGHLSDNLSKIEEVFQKYNPAYPFDYSFVDEDFDRKFKTIDMTSQLATLFAGLAVLITGLGLFGLASYTAEQRSKEIGIRKVLGASVGSLMMLMTKDFTKLVLVAFVLAVPFAWYLLDMYLDRYEIRTEIHWWLFPLVGVVALAFALMIVINQARMASLANPVDSLKDE